MAFKFFKTNINHGHLYINTEDADVFFVIENNDGNSTRIPAHKNLLATRSKVFSAMFSSNWKQGDVTLIGISVGAFMQFLEYFYLNYVKITSKYVTEVMIIADRYDVQQSVDDCTQFLAEVLGPENVLSVLDCAMICRQDELLKLCENQLILNTSTILKTADFLECGENVLEHILKIDYFSCREVEVLTACMEWVKAKAKEPVLSKEMVEKYLGKLFYQIRFASITMQELCSLPSEYDDILANDFQKIVKIIVVPGFKSSTFSTNRRQITLDADRKIRSK